MAERTPPPDPTEDKLGDAAQESFRSNSSPLCPKRCPKRPVLGRSRSKSGRLPRNLWSKPARNWSKPAQSWSKPAQSWSNSVHGLVELGQALAEIGHSLVELRLVLPKIGQNRPHPGRHRFKSGRSRPKLADICPDLVLPKCGRARSNLGRSDTEFWPTPNQWAVFRHVHPTERPEGLLRNLAHCAYA